MKGDESGTGLFGSLLTTVALNVKDLLHGRNVDITPEFSNSSASSEDNYIALTSLEDFSKPLEPIDTLEHEVVRIRKNPMMYNNIMSDIPFLEEKISQLDMNDDLSKFNADYVVNMNKMGYLCLPDGSVVQAPKMQLKMKKKKTPLDLIERNFINENSFQELENTTKLEKMFEVLTLLNLNYSSEDENVLKNYLIDSGDVPIVCKLRKEHSVCRSHVKTCRYAHLSFCSLCISDCPICFYLKLKELREDEHFDPETLNYQHIIDLISAQEKLYDLNYLSTLSSLAPDEAIVNLIRRDEKTRDLSC